jgi:hypothetical protein
MKITGFFNVYKIKEENGKKFFYLRNKKGKNIKAVSLLKDNKSLYKSFDKNIYLLMNVRCDNDECYILEIKKEEPNA